MSFHCIGLSRSMVSVVTLDGSKNEIKPLEAIMRDIAAFVSDDEWDFTFCSSVSEFQRIIDGQPLIDIGCYDVALNGAMESLFAFRNQYDSSLLILIADASISPITYLKPGIRPDSLLMRPLSKVTVRELINEVFSTLTNEIDKADGSKSYVIDSKDGKTSIPYKNIYYIEAREKKIFIRTLNDEFGFYETIEKIQEDLPENFERCHRSFIVNKDKIRKIMLSQNLMELEDGFEVPLSRSFKPMFKNYGK